MVVKVVGNDPAQVKYTSCHGCASKLEYVKNDVFKHEHSHDYTGGKEMDNAIRCPCGTIVLV